MPSTLGFVGSGYPEYCGLLGWGPHGDFVEEEDLRGAQEAAGDLDAPPLAVGYRVHAPLLVDVEDVDDALPPGGVDVGDAVEHLARGEVAGEGHGVPGKRDVALPVAANVGESAGGGKRCGVEGGLLKDADGILHGGAGFTRRRC